MIKVSLELYTPWELAVIHEGMTIIHKARENQIAGNISSITAEAAQIIRGAAIVEEEPAPPESQVIAAITPEGVMKAAQDASPKISVTDLEVAVMAYHKKHGMPKTLELVKAFGPGRVAEIPSEKWPELMEKLQDGLK